MNSDKHKKRSPVDVTDKSQNKQKQMTVNFISVDKLGDASESTSTSSLSKMNTLKQSSINTVLQKENVTRAEIMWALEILMNNYSIDHVLGRTSYLLLYFQIVLLPRNFNWVKRKQVM